MKLSTKTLADIRDLIPRHLRGRYNNEEFPKNRFNELSRHLEKYCDTRYLTDQMIIPLLDGTTDYKMDDRVRQTRGIYEVPSGEVTPDKNAPLRYEEMGNFIRLDALPTVNTPPVAEDEVVSDATDSTLLKLVDNDVGSTLADEQDFTGWGIIVEHPSGVKDHRLIVSSDDTEQSVTINGEFSTIPLDGTKFSLYFNFVILEFVIYLPTLTAITDVIGVPQDFETVYEMGLHWKYYVQEGENRTEIDKYWQLFEQEKTRFCSDQNRFRSDNKPIKPRVIPNIFP